MAYVSTAIKQSALFGGSGIFTVKKAWIHVFSLGLIFLLGFSIYSNTYHNEFVFDDFPNIIEEPARRLTKLDLPSILKALFSGQRNSRRFIANISFALNYYFGRLNPAGYHLVNILVHCLASVVLFWIIYLTFRTPAFKGKYHNISLPVSLFASLIFVSHPVHTQSVVYVVQRMNSMAALFYLCAILFYNLARRTKDHQKGLYFCVVFSFLLAVSCKETAYTIPAVLFLYEYLFFQGAYLKKTIGFIKAALAVFGSIFFVIFILYGSQIIVEIKVYADILFKEQGVKILQRLLIEARVVNYYFSLLFLPLYGRLNLDYDFPASRSLIDPMTTLFSVVFIFFFVYLGVYLRKKNPFLSFCMLCYPITLSVTSIFIPLVFIFEHRLYLPSVGIISAMVFLLFTKLKEYHRILYVCLILIITLFSVNAYQRNKVWSSRVTLWEDTVHKSPRLVRPHHNLGRAYKDRGEYDKATEEFKKILELDPSYMPAYWGLGEVSILKGEVEDAEGYFQRLLHEKEYSAAAHVNLGYIENKRGHTENAVIHYREALSLDPGFVMAYSNLGDIYVAQNSFDEALQVFQRALDIDPSDTAIREKSAKIFLARNDLDSALSEYREAVAVKPDDPNLRAALGNVLFLKGRLEESSGEFESALRMDPHNDAIMTNLGLVCMKMGYYDESRRHLTRALEFNPMNPDVLYNLACLHALLGERDQALSYLERAIHLGGRHYRDLAIEDEDLSNIRASTAFEAIISR